MYYFYVFIKSVFGIFAGKRNRTATYTSRRFPPSRTRPKCTRRHTNASWKTRWAESSRGSPGLKPVRICVNISFFFFSLSSQLKHGPVKSRGVYYCLYLFIFSVFFYPLEKLIHRPLTFLFNIIPTKYTTEY